MMDGLDVAYENTVDRRWGERAVEFLDGGLLQVKASEVDGVVSAQVSGPCPRCEHALDVRSTLAGAVADVRAGRDWLDVLTGRAAAVTRVPEIVQVACDCGQAHRGAPPGGRGCGVSFRLPTRPPSAATAPKAWPTPSDSA